MLHTDDDTRVLDAQCGKQYMMHDAYMLDVGCSFPNVKVRKHCRSLTCEFCIDKRDIISSPSRSDVEKSDAKDRLTLHLNWRSEGLPRTLYLQLDNCFRENKNTSVAACLCWLAERLVFDEIFLLFLHTGHTHFDPDQYHTCHIATAIAGCGSGRGVSRSRVPQIQRDQ